MSEMIERVAQAICGDDNPANILAIHRSRARAAIEAMREPTDEMMMAAEHDVPELESFADKDKSPSYIAWQAMIDAANTSGIRK